MEITVVGIPVIGIPVVQRGREVVWRVLAGVAAAWRSSAGDGARLLPGWCDAPAGFPRGGAVLVDFRRR
jgi:hypothetical protein